MIQKNESLPKITIVTPSYNQGRYIEDAIKSVIHQNYPNVEHIIMDSLSTDDTFEVVSRYSDYSHIQWVSEKDEGQTDAINKGFSLATGDILAWLNCDDYYSLGTFHIVSEYFALNSEVDIVYGDVEFVDSDKSHIRFKKDHKFDRGVLTFYGTYISSTTTFFRRRIIDDGIYLDKSFRVTMDYEYFMRLLNLGYVYGYIPKILASFRWHGDNISLRMKVRQEFERREVIKKYTIFKQPDSLVQTVLLKLLKEGYRLKRQYLKKRAGG